MIAGRHSGGKLFTTRDGIYGWQTVNAIGRNRQVTDEDGRHGCEKIRRLENVGRQLSDVLKAPNAADSACVGGGLLLDELFDKRHRDTPGLLGHQLSGRSKDKEGGCPHPGNAG